MGKTSCLTVLCCAKKQTPLQQTTVQANTHCSLPCVDNILTLSKQDQRCIWETEKCNSWQAQIECRDGGEVVLVNSCWLTKHSTCYDREKLSSCNTALPTPKLSPAWPPCTIIKCMALFSSWLLLQCPLVLNYEKASNSIWGGQKVFILPGFTGLTLNGPLMSLSFFIACK